jgi:hypothetical protein
LYINFEIMSAKTKVSTKTKTALKEQETYNLSDLKHNLNCGFVELGGSLSVSSDVTNTIDSKTSSF